MPGKRKSTREKDITSRYLSGELDEDRLDTQQRFNKRSKHHQQNKILRTALMRSEEPINVTDVDSLPVGQVIQVHSLFLEVEHESHVYLCVVRKTLKKTSDTDVIVGDQVRF